MPDKIEAVPQGLSSDMVVRIIVKGSPYLLRLMTRRNESMDPRRIYSYMSAAAKEGLAPGVRYSDTEEGILIVDYFETVPLSLEQALLQVPLVLARLHSMRTFDQTFNYVTAHNGFVWKFRRAGLLPEIEVEQVFSSFDRICAVYPRVDSDRVSCHNDLKPENILYDGRQVLFAGWQAAMANDRYFDLAVAANFLVHTRDDQSAYLSAYFGRPPDEFEQARFFLMRQVVHLLSASVFLILGSAGKPVELAETPPSFREFHARLWASKTDLSDPHRKTEYGLVHWKQLSENLLDARFDHALRVVAERGAARDTTDRLLPVAF